MHRRTDRHATTTLRPIILDNLNCVLFVLPVLGILCFVIGSVLGYRGFWTNSAIGIIGILVIGLGGVFWSIFILIVCRQGVWRSNPGSNTPEPTLEAGAAPDPELTVPNMTLQEAVTTGDETVFVIQTNGVLPGGHRMAPQSFNMQTTISGNTQAFQKMLQNFTGAAIPATTDPMPNPEAKAPPFTYPVVHPPPPAANRMGVVEPSPGVEDLPSPPSPEDVITWRVNLDKENGKI